MISSWYYCNYISILEEKVVQVHKKVIKRYNIKENATYESLLKIMDNYPNLTNTSPNNIIFNDIKTVYIPIYDSMVVVDCIKFILNDRIELSYFVLIYLHAKACSIVYKNKSLNINGVWYDGKFDNLIYGPNISTKIYDAFVICEIDINRNYDNDILC